MNGSRRRLTLVALAALAVADARPTHANYRGVTDSFLREGHAVLEGAVLGAGTQREAVERCMRLGFVAAQHESGDAGLVVVSPLKVGRLEWHIGTRGQWALLDARTVHPLTARKLYAGEPPWYPPEPGGGDLYVETPNHAVRVAGIIGMVPVERYVKEIERQYPLRNTPVPMDFGRPFDLPDLDGIARDALIPGGWVRVIVASSDHLKCAAWANCGYGRWIGIVLESDDLDATARWFDAQSVPWRPIERGVPGIAVDPEHTGGVLLEFVAKGYQPQL